MPKGLRETVHAAPNTAMRELLKDIVLGTQFRRDIYLAGTPVPGGPEPRKRRLAGLRFALLPHATAAPKTLRIPAG